MSSHRQIGGTGRDAQGAWSVHNLHANIAKEPPGELSNGPAGRDVMKYYRLPRGLSI